MVSARAVVFGLITGALLIYLANFIGGLAPFLPAPYGLYVTVVAEVILGIVPLLVGAGIIPAATFGLAITGAFLTMVGNLFIGFSKVVPAPGSTVLFVVGSAIIVVAQVLVANGIIPALRRL